MAVDELFTLESFITGMMIQGVEMGRESRCIGIWAQMSVMVLGCASTGIAFAGHPPGETLEPAIVADVTPAGFQSITNVIPEFYLDDAQTSPALLGRREEQPFCGASDLRTCSKECAQEWGIALPKTAVCAP